MTITSYLHYWFVCLHYHKYMIYCFKSNLDDKKICLFSCILKRCQHNKTTCIFWYLYNTTITLYVTSFISLFWEFMCSLVGHVHLPSLDHAWDLILDQCSLALHQPRQAFARMCWHHPEWQHYSCHSLYTEKEKGGKVITRLT